MPKRILVIPTLLFLLAGLTLFHFAVLLKIIPANWVWGGRLKESRNLVLLESASILINLFLGFIILIKGGFIRPLFSQKVIHIILWIYMILFLLNAFGNLLAQTAIERSFSILSLVFAILTGIILLKIQSGADTQELNKRVGT